MVRGLVHGQAEEEVQGGGAQSCSSGFDREDPGVRQNSPYLTLMHCSSDRGS